MLYCFMVVIVMLVSEATNINVLTNKTQLYILVYTEMVNKVRGRKYYIRKFMCFNRSNQSKIHYFFVNISVMLVQSYALISAFSCLIANCDQTTFLIIVGSAFECASIL